MMSNKSNKKTSLKNRVMNEPGNLFLSWNKSDKICIPLKLNKQTKNKFFSSKKINASSFPKLEDTKKSQKRISSSFKLLPPNEKSKLIQLKLENEQTKVNTVRTILPKINLNSPNQKIMRINMNGKESHLVILMKMILLIIIIIIIIKGILLKKKL